MDAAGDDGRWMTYDELAEARGIDRQSARRMANRTRWRRQKDNRGVVRVFVPLEQAAPARRHRDTPAAMTAVSADAPADMTRAISVLETALAAVERRAEAEAAALREHAKHAEKLAEQAEIRAKQAEARADQAQQAIEAAQNRAERAETRADRAEPAIDAERNRADTLRDQIELIAGATRSTPGGHRRGGGTSPSR